MMPEDFAAKLRNGRTVKVAFQRRLGSPGSQELWEILVKDESGKVLETMETPLAMQGPDRNERLREQANLILEKLNAGLGPA